MLVYTYNPLTMRYEPPAPSQEHIADWNALLDALAALEDTPLLHAPRKVPCYALVASQSVPHEDWRRDQDGTLRSPDGYRAGVDPEGNYVRL